MSTTTHVSPVSGVPPRLAELAKGLGKRLRCLVSSPPSRTVSLANPLADTFLKLRLSGSSRPAHPRNHAELMIPSRPGRRPAGPDRKRGGREGRRFYRPPQPRLIPHRPATTIMRRSRAVSRPRITISGANLVPEKNRQPRAAARSKPGHAAAGGELPRSQRLGGRRGSAHFRQRPNTLADAAGLGPRRTGPGPAGPGPAGPGYWPWP